MVITDFSAREPSLGYYHQIRYSLYLLLQNKERSNSYLKLEYLDDIVIEDIDATDLFQTKLHINSVANLTDRSADFWKTIRVWGEAINSKQIDINNTICTLITTAKVSEDSFIKNFKANSNSNNLDETYAVMQQISLEQTNATNINGYKAFRNLTVKQQKTLLENIRVIDASLSIEQTLSAIKKELTLCAPAGKIDSFLERLEGWWFQQCIEMLCNKKDAIQFRELHQKMSDIRDTFQQDNLPDDFASPIIINENELSDYEERVFVHQLKIIAIKNTILRNAISDFRRAYDQRSKWLRENLTNIAEYDHYENQLQDYWNNIFSIVRDDCEGLSDNELEKIGREFYKKYFVENIPPYRIRDKFQSAYLTRGSCHMLADEMKIGWHPKFENILEK